MDVKENLHEALMVLGTKLIGGSEVFEERISIPVIGGDICIGSNNLRARSDVGKVLTSFAVMVEDDFVGIEISDFQNPFDGSSLATTGLVIASGVSSVELVSPPSISKFCLGASIDDIKLKGEVGDTSGLSSSGNFSKSRSYIEFEEPVAIKFAVGCIRAMQKIPNHN